MTPAIGYPGAELRPAGSTTDDAARFCELYNSLYKRRVDEAYYRWQFFDTPFPSTLSFAVAPDGELLGCYGMQVLRCEPAGKPAAWARDIMIVPRLQGRGLFRVLAGHAARGVLPYGPVALLIMANQRSERAHVGGLGWRLVRELVDFESGPARPERPKLELTSCGVGNLEELAEVDARGGADRDLTRSARSPEFLDWRFRRNPLYSYDLMLARGEGRANGYLALKSFTDPASGAVFGDVVDVASSGADFGDLLEAARAYFRARGIGRVSTWLQTNTALDAAGAALGFTATGRRRYFCARVLDADHAHLADGGRWRITMADAEIY